MKFILIIFAFLFSLLVSAATPTTTSMVQIMDFRCDKTANSINGKVTTGNDLGGANYQLTFKGDLEITQVFCDVFEVLKAKKSFVSLKVSQLKEVKGTDTYSGVLHAIVIASPND